MLFAIEFFRLAGVILQLINAVIDYQPKTSEERSNKKEAR